MSGDEQSAGGTGQAGAGGVPPATEVEFRRSGVRAPWDPDCPSLLDFAEDNGLTVDFSCRSGICGTCVTTLVAGRVTYFDEPLDAPDEGTVLLCCCKPDGPVVLDL